MKKFILLMTIIVALVLVAIPTVAGPMDTVKEWAGAFGWKAVAGILSALLLIGGVAAKARWFSGILITLGSVLVASGGLLNFGGVVLQDGKIDDTELKQAKPQWQATLKTIRDAWAAIRGQPNG
ncbi:hypothetical protein ACFL55_01700 [Candidatus Latescibacterota bacterium]